MAPVAGAPCVCVKHSDGHPYSGAPPAAVPQWHTAVGYPCTHAPTHAPAKPRSLGTGGIAFMAACLAAQKPLGSDPATDPARGSGAGVAGAEAPGMLLRREAGLLLLPPLGAAWELMH